MAEAILENPRIPAMAEPEDVELRRCSTGKIGTHGGMTIVSRYLRTPMGSCHDLCKYGVKHAVETNPMSPMSKCLAPARGEGQNLEKKEGCFGEGKKKSDINLESSNDSKARGPKGPAFIHVTADQGQHLEKNEANSAERKKESEISLKLSVDHRTVGLEDPVVVENAMMQDEDQNMEISESSSVEGKKKSEITLMPSAEAKTHEAEDPAVKGIALMETEDQNLGKGENGSAERKEKSEVGVKPYPDFKTQELDDLLVINRTSTEDRGRILEKSETSSMAIKSRSETIVKSSPDSEVEKLDDPVVLEIIRTPGADQNPEKTKPNVAKRKKRSEISVPSSLSPSQKPVDTAFDRRKVSSLRKEENFSLKKVTSPTDKTDASMAHLRDSKLKLRSMLSSPPKPAWSNGKGNIASNRSKEMAVLSMNSHGVSRSKSDGKSRTNQEIRASNTDGKSAEPKSVSLPPKEPGNRVSGKNANIWKNPGEVSHLKNYVNVKKTASQQQSSGHAKNSRILKGVSHLKNQVNVRKTGPYQPSCEDPPEKSIGIIDLDSDTTAGSIQNSVQASKYSPLLSSSCKKKSMKRTQNGIPTGKSTSSSEKKNVIRRQKRVQVDGSSISLPSVTQKRVLRYTTNGINLLHSSSLSSPNSASSKSSPSSASPEQYATDSERQTRSTRMPFKCRHKRVVSGPSLSLPSPPGKKILRRTQNGINLFQSSSLKSPNLIPSQSSPYRASPEHYATDAERQTRSTRMPYKGRPKRAHVSGPSLSLPSPPGKRILRRTQNGVKLFQSSSLTSPNLTPSKCSPCSASPEHYVTDAERKTRSTRMPYKSRPKRVGANTPKDKVWLGRTLNFKRGKVIELPVVDYTPKRLRFRRRVFGDNKNGDDARRISILGTESEASQDAISDTNSEIVVSKLQDMEEKKDSRSLFNNVIEETASKLVETRKSKVKALVGAFETVISLQDTKTSAATSAR